MLIAECDDNLYFAGVQWKDNGLRREYFSAVIIGLGIAVDRVGIKPLRRKAIL
jgi:hypothetical protein